MKRLITGLLLAATAMMPVAAQAQQREMRPDREQRRAQRAEGAAPVDREARQAQRAERQQRRAAPVPTAQPMPTPAMRDRQPDRVRPGRPLAERPAPGLRQDRREDRRDVRQDNRADRRDFRDDRRDNRQDYRGGQQGNWGQNAYRGGQVWNRSWRNDRRYDYNGYRARNRGAYRLPRYYAPSGYGYRYQRFNIGVTLGRAFLGQNYWLDDPYEYRLPAAYGPYRWVRYYGDALLVDLRTGRVIDVVNDIFY
jgi:hypothetical protein